LVHFHQACIDLNPRGHIRDAPQLVGVLAKVTSLDLADVVDAADEHEVILEVTDDLLVHELRRIKGAFD